MAKIDLLTLIRHHPRTARMRNRSPRVIQGLKPSRSSEIQYRNELLPIVEHLDRAGVALAREVKSEWSHVGDSADVPLLIVDAPARAARSARFDATVERVAARFGNIGKTAERLAWAAAQREYEDVDERLAKTLLQSVSVDIGPLLIHDRETTAAMGRAVEANVDLITSIPQQYFGRIRDVLAQSFAEGKRWNALVDQIKDIGHVTENRAILIARDQTGKMNADFNRVRQTGIGIESYRWRGALDQRERKSHVDMEGSRCKWDAPPAVDGEHVHPGEAIQCRCWGDPEIYVDEIEQQVAA